MKGGKAPEFRFHRFWAQSHVALAYATYGWLFPKEESGGAAAPAKTAKAKKK